MPPDMTSRMREASVKIANFLKLEIGIAATESSFDLRDNIFTVQIEGGLAPVEQIVARSPMGPDLLMRIYDVAHKDYADHIGAIVTRVLGIDVMDSRTRVDASHCSISIIFLLAHSAPA